MGHFDFKFLAFQSFDIKVEEHFKSDMINQQSLDSIKIKDEEKIQIFDHLNTRVVHNVMNVIKVEDENNCYEMFPGTNSFHIKVHKDHNIAQQVVCNETLLSSTDSIKIECEEIKSNKNVLGMRFLQKNTNAKSKLKFSTVNVL